MSGQNDNDDVGNWNGDNLAFGPQDDADENEFFNWRNHPIRQLFDNPRTASHRSFLDDEEQEDEE
jgi:hypothetical protein